jgi:predicted DNA-binding transcriptional regulator AlpA
MESRLLTDADVMRKLQISRRTFYRMMRGEQIRTAINLRDAEPVVVGRQRRWDEGKLDALISASTKQKEEVKHGI